MNKVVGEHKDKVFLLSSPGIASNVVFKSRMHHRFCVYMEVESDDEVSINNVASAITTDKEAYNGKVGIHSSKSEVSPALSKLLSLLSPEDLYEDSLLAIHIGNMITSRTANRYTDLLLSLVVMVRKKQIVQHLYDYGVVCSYNELVGVEQLLPRQVKGVQGVLGHHSTCLIHAVAENFDCDISSMNGLKQTHSLALMLIQQGIIEKQKQF